MALLGLGQAQAQEVPAPEAPVQTPAQPDPLPPEPIDPRPLPVNPPSTEAVPPSPQVRAQTDWQPRTRFGTALLLGGGVDNFMDDGIDDLTGLGGVWNLRLISGTRAPVAFELGYMGDAHDITGPAITEDDFVLRNRVEGALRLQFPWSFAGPACWSRSPWWASAGAATRWSTRAGRHLHAEQRPPAVGAGRRAAWRRSYRGFMFDARFTYRLAARTTTCSATADMAAWNVGASLGAEF